MSSHSLSPRRDDEARRFDIEVDLVRSLKAEGLVREAERLEGVCSREVLSDPVSSLMLWKRKRRRVDRCQRGRVSDGRCERAQRRCMNLPGEQYETERHWKKEKEGEEDASEEEARPRRVSSPRSLGT